MAWEELKETLDRLSDSPSSQLDSMFAAPAADDREVSVNGASSGPIRRGGAAEKRRLRFESDLRLTMYKHWTLEESIQHSAYFYCAMELHRDKGQRALKNLFATAGIPPQDYKQIYAMMQWPIRLSLPQKFKDYGKAHGLVEPQMFLQQFVRETGLLEDKNALFLHDLSSMDAAQIIIAVLSAVPASLSGARLDSLPQNPDGSADYDAVNELERQANIENFWRAFDVVLCKEHQSLAQGIAEAVEMTKAVQTMALLLKDSKAMHTTRLFRWCKIEQPPHMFRNPHAVRCLAVWLLQVFFTYRPKSHSRVDLPLLVIVRDRVRDTYLLVGTTPTSLAMQDEFGNRFRNVLQTAKFACRYDFFDKSCIEIAADDFDRFWDTLCK